MAETFGRRHALEAALGHLGGGAVKYFGDRADLNEDVLRKLALMRATEAMGERALGQQAEADFAQEEFFVQPREEQMRRSVIAQAISPEMALPTGGPAGPSANIPAPYPGDPRVEAFQRQHGPTTSGIMMPSGPGGSPLTIEDVRRGAGAKTALSRPRFTGPEITAASRTEAARINAEERAGRAGAKQPQWADIVSKETQRIQSQIASRKQRGRPVEGVGPEDIQLQATLTAALTYRADPRYPEADAIGKLAAALEPFRTDPQAYLGKFADIYRGAMAKPPEVKQKNAAFYAVLERMRNRVQRPGWFTSAGLSAPVAPSE